MEIVWRRVCGCALILVFGAWIATAVVAGAGSSMTETVSANVATLEEISMATAFLGLLGSIWIISSIVYGAMLVLRPVPQRLVSGVILALTVIFVTVAITDRIARVGGPVHLSTSINAYMSMLVLMVALAIFAAIVDLFMPPWPASTQWPQSQE